MRLVVLLMLLTSAALAADPPIEATVLPEFADIARWYTAECTIEAVDDAPGEVGQATHWHVDVDHFTGEPKYPIGWPRCGTTPADKVWDWSGYDSLRFEIRCETSRAALPDQAVGMVITMPDRGTQRSVYLDVAQNDWTAIVVPIDELVNPTQVSRLQFYISESNWKHGDTLDCWIADLRLVKYSAPVVLDFAPLEALVVAESPYLVATVRAAGIADGESADAELVVRQNGQVRHRSPVQLLRGSQRLIAPVAGLQPGTAELSINLGGAETAAAEVTIIAGPFGD